MIYAIRGKHGYIKIGYTSNLKKRHVDLCCDHKRNLVILAIGDGDMQTERDIHSRFERYRLYSSKWNSPPTDWFLPMQIIYQWIESELTPYTDEQSFPNWRTTGGSDVDNLVLKEALTVNIACMHPIIFAEMVVSP